MEIPWHYLVNQFINSTKENYKKMLKLSNYHDARLKKMMIDNPADPEWATLYNRYHPFHEAYVAAYSAWKSAGGTQKGQTLNLAQLLVLLRTKINKWDAMIQAVDGFEKGGANHLALFPKGHRPFVAGAKAAKVSAVKVLGESLAPFALAHPEIGAVKGLVDAFFTLLNDARTTQEGTKGGTRFRSIEVEKQRIIVGTEQYRSLGSLIVKCADKPLTIASFFELVVLRDHLQVLFTGTLDASENEPVLTHTFVADDELALEITTTETVAPETQVAFYLATTQGGTDSTPVLVTANAAKTTIQISDFGISDYGTHRYLTAVNLSAFELHYKVEML
ncbi:MAG: hypothetical protein AB7G44_11520 [Bacteroidia bacterium]